MKRFNLPEGLLLLAGRLMSGKNNTAEVKLLIGKLLALSTSVQRRYLCCRYGCCGCSFGANYGFEPFL